MYQINFDDPIHVHFIGIGGISMSGLAEVLLDRHFTVSGSDRAENELIRHLEKLGAKVSFPQRAVNITDDIDCVVYTAAIHPDNPEFAEAKSRGIPMLTRAQLLGEIMKHYDNSIAVAGTHGKTTTSSMISQILLEGKKDPTLSIGGIFKAINSNIHVGSSDLFLTEACEYTNSFLSLFAKYSVILNVEAEHLDFFKDIDDIRNSFHQFAKDTKADGAVIINDEIPDYRQLVDGIDARVITVGFNEGADYHASDISYDKTGEASFEVTGFGQDLGQVRLSVPGRHNVGNALAAIAVARELGFDMDQIRAGLAKFGGAKRRLELKGKYHGATVIDDYAHHPTEVRASLEAAGRYPHKKLYVVFQPHTYTRTKAFLDQFADALSQADQVVLAEIFPAREKDIYGVHSADLCEKVRERGTACEVFPSFDQIEEFLQKNIADGDLLITMGAGDVYKIGEDLLKQEL
ncbi:MAG: UDP-N-acetylmuramate--L-alanine ligase [Lachnospiraceae bacterium]|nr:UDP-N-acetylmuramate--L-alanine ligase [Lachnospiraceae bacterium]